MDGFLGIIGQMITLFSIVAVGYAAKRAKFMTQDFDRMLSKLILSIALPAMIIGSVLDAESIPSLDNILTAFLLSCASYALVILIAYIVTFALRIDVGYRGVFKFMMCFGNVGFIGFPVLSSLFGNEALLYGAIFNLPFNVLVFTIGIVFITQDNSEDVRLNTTWKTFMTPAIIACALTIALALLSIHDVPIVGAAFSTLGSMTTPAALLIIGSSLAALPVKTLIGGPRLWIVSLFRLLIIPACVWGVFHFFVADALMLSIIIVISGMPVATNGTMLCYQYHGNERVMAQGTFVTTVLSVLSIPLLVQCLKVLVG